MEDDVPKIGNLGLKSCFIIIAFKSKVEFSYVMLRSVGSTLRCQINKSTRLVFLDFPPPYLHFFHTT